MLLKNKGHVRNIELLKLELKTLRSAKGITPTQFRSRMKIPLASTKSTKSHRLKSTKMYKVFEEKENDLKSGFVWTSNKSTFKKEHRRNMSEYKELCVVSRKVSSTKILQAMSSVKNINFLLFHL